MKQSNRKKAIQEELEQTLHQLFLDGIDGNESSYQVFLEEIAEILRSFLVSVMSVRQQSEIDVEDLIQNVLFAIHRKRDLYRRDMPIIPWVHAIARYRFFDLLRARSRRIETVEWTKEFDDLFSDSEHRSEESGVDVNALLADLSDKERTLLQLAKVDELSYSQIADKSGMTVAAVKVAIHRILKKLRSK